MGERGEITLLLDRVLQGDDSALDDLARLAFPELRRLAAACLRDQRPGHTWFPTDLVNELWVRLLRRETLAFETRTHFLGVAVHLMRALVLDHAKARCARKRMPVEGAGGLGDLPFSERDAAELVALDVAPTRLGELSERQARVVEMRYFAGFSVDETADAMELSPKTVKREWAAARAWLFAELREVQP